MTERITNSDRRSMWVEEAALNPRYLLEATGVLSRIYEDRLRTLCHAGPPLPLSKVFVEMGSFDDPFVSAGLKALGSGFPADYTDLPKVALCDYTYNQAGPRLGAVSKLLHAVGPSFYHLNRFRRDELWKDGVSDEEKYSDGRKLLENYIQLTIDDAGVPRFQLPEDNDINLAFVSLANYVDMADLVKYTQDPKVRSLAFVNGSDAGIAGFHNFSEFFHPNRAKSSLDLIEAFELQGFEILDRVFEVFRDGDYIEKTAPAMGVFMIRPKNEEERQWIINHRKLTLLDPFVEYEKRANEKIPNRREDLV